MVDHVKEKYRSSEAQVFTAIQKHGCPNIDRISSTKIIFCLASVIGVSYLFLKVARNNVWENEWNTEGENLRRFGKPKTFSLPQIEDEEDLLNSPHFPHRSFVLGNGEKTLYVLSKIHPTDKNCGIPPANYTSDNTAKRQRWSFVKPTRNVTGLCDGNLAMQKCRLRAEITKPMLCYNLTEWMKVLTGLSNFFFGLVKLEDFYANTSLQDFFNGALSLSRTPTEHQSDLLRFYVLYLYGGTYMDLDVISLRSLDDLKVNYLGQETMFSVACGIMNFEPRHQFLKTSLYILGYNFEPDKWASLGPDVVTKTLDRFCHYKPVKMRESSLHLKSCNVTVHPTKTFYAVKGIDAHFLYETNMWPEVEKMIRESHVLHYWNNGGTYPLVIGSNQPLMKLAEQHCKGVCNVAEAIPLLLKNVPLTSKNKQIAEYLFPEPDSVKDAYH